MGTDISAVSSLFPWRDLAEICRYDSRIRFFVDRGSSAGRNVRQFVDWNQVLTESDQARAFADATALPSYAQFAELAHSSAQAAAEIDKLTAGPNLAALRRFLTTRPILFLVTVLVLLLALPERGAFAGLIAAVVLAPVTGLAWHAAAVRRNAAYFFLGMVCGVLGIAALTVPLAFGFRYSYVSLLFLFAFLCVTFAFGLDHSRRPGIKDIKTLMLRPRDYPLARRARRARAEWLGDALDEAVMSELVQTINRLLGPEKDKRLLVQDTRGLRVTYSTESRVSTHALRRAEDALRRSDGASIAVSGPRGCGKTNLLKQLCDAESRFCVLVSAPTQYMPREFLIELFQRLCTEYIKSRKFPIENDSGLVQGWLFTWVLRSRPVQFARAVLALVLTGLLVWDITGWTATRHIDRMPGWLWRERPLVTGMILAALIVLILPKRNWRTGFRGTSEPPLVTQARRYLLQLQAEQTATVQLSGTLPVMQAAISRAVAQRSLPWTMPELVAHLKEFMTRIAETEYQEANRKVLICIDEVDRIGSADEAARFVSEIKAIFGEPNCYFFVAIADELGLSLSSGGINGRSVVDNAFDEVISIEPMSFESCRELLTRRVPGFTESFAWLSFVLSAGLPRDLIRVARRLAEMAETAIESDYELSLTESADRLIREEAYAAAINTRSQLTQLSPDQEWEPALEQLRLCTKELQPTAVSTDPRLTLKVLAQLPGLVPVPVTSGPSAVRDAIARLAAFALLSLTTCDLFRDDVYEIAKFCDPTHEPLGSYAEMAAARRELSVSPGASRAAVEKIRIALSLG